MPHSHESMLNNQNEQKVFVSFLLIFTFMIVEIAGGIISGSLALIADAGHMFTDAAALALAYIAFRIGRRKPDTRRTYGYSRFEVIAGFINSVTLFIIVGWIFFEAWERIQEPPQILSGPMLIVAIAGLLVNILALWILSRGDNEHVNIRGALAHVLGDLLGSIGAIMAAIIIYYTNWTPVDPILSIIVSLLILRTAWKLLRQSLHILLEGVPEGASPEEIENHLMKTIPEIESVSHIHTWQISSGRRMATLHVRPVESEPARKIEQLVERELRSHFNIDHATVALDWRQESVMCSLIADDSKDHEIFQPRHNHEKSDKTTK